MDCLLLLVLSATSRRPCHESGVERYYSSLQKMFMVYVNLREWLGRVSIKVTDGWFWGDSYWGYPALVHKPGPSCGSHLGRFSAAKDLHVHAKGQLLQSLFSPQIQMLRARMPGPVLAPLSHPWGDQSFSKIFSHLIVLDILSDIPSKTVHKYTYTVHVISLNANHL